MPRPAFFPFSPIFPATTMVQGLYTKLSEGFILPNTSLSPYLSLKLTHSPVQASKLLLTQLKCFFFMGLLFSRGRGGCSHSFLIVFQGEGRGSPTLLSRLQQQPRQGQKMQLSLAYSTAACVSYPTDILSCCVSTLYPTTQSPAA